LYSTLPVTAGMLLNASDVYM